MICFVRFWHFLTCFENFLTFFDIFLTDRQTDWQMDRPTYLIWHVLTLFDMFWPFFDSFWHFLTFFWLTDRHTEPRCRSSDSELKNRTTSKKFLEFLIDSNKFKQILAKSSIFLLEPPQSRLIIDHCSYTVYNSIATLHGFEKVLDFLLM